MIIRSFLKTNMVCFKIFKQTGQFFTNDKVIDQNQQKKDLTKSYGQLNSIKPGAEEGYAYGHYFPKEWTEQQIAKILDPSLKQIERVTVVKNRVGEHSGKVLIKFKNELVRKKYIDKYNEDYILWESQSQKVVILPFQLKTQIEKRKAREGLNFKNPVRISNLDFDITKHQLLKLAADYGNVSHIDLHERQSGINRGFATVYFQTKQSAVQFTNFIDGFLYRDRKLKAHVVEKRPQKHEIEFLEVPTFTFQANEELMKKVKAKEYQAK